MPAIGAKNNQHNVPHNQPAQLDDLLFVLRRDPRDARKLARIRELLQKKVCVNSTYVCNVCNCC